VIFRKPAALLTIADARQESGRVLLAVESVPDVSDSGAKCSRTAAMACWEGLGLTPPMRIGLVARGYRDFGREPKGARGDPGNLT
jgi:hypothetical protein